MKKEKVLTFEAALRYLGISNKTFYDKYRKNGLESVAKKGRAHLYRLSDIDEISKKLNIDSDIHERFEIIE